MILRIDTPDQFERALDAAAGLLRAGRAVAIPTETVYGLAANAFSASAVRELFRIKQRPALNPLIVHVGRVEMARACASCWPSSAEKLAQAFWPGPLTLVLERSGKIPDVVVAGGRTVGLRWPAHPFAQALITKCDFPLAAPSANRSAEVSPTAAHHVQESLGRDVELIVDAGPTIVGIESTVVDLSVSPPRVLRPGMIQIDHLRAVIGDVASGPAPSEAVLKSPGLLRRHYSPKARLLIWSWKNETELALQAANLNVPRPKIHVLGLRHMEGVEGFGQVRRLPDTPDAYGRMLYAELRRSDAEGADVIILEAPPETSDWLAIWDRLDRAAAAAD